MPESGHSTSRWTVIPPDVDELGYKFEGFLINAVRFHLL